MSLLRAEYLRVCRKCDLNPPGFRRDRALWQSSVRGNEMNSYLPNKNGFGVFREFGQPYQWQRYGSLRNTVQVATRKQRSPGELAAIKRDEDNHVMREIAFVCWLDATVWEAEINREIERIGEAVR